MRLDKFLKVSRLIKRRTVAKDIADKARIFVNDNPAKPAKELKVGDKITIEYLNMLWLRILRKKKIPKNCRPVSFGNPTVLPCMRLLIWRPS